MMLLQRCYGCLSSDQDALYECPSCHGTYCLVCLREGCPAHMRIAEGE